jgi:hypothetical protein
MHSYTQRSSSPSYFTHIESFLYSYTTGVLFLVFSHPLFYLDAVLSPTFKS